MSINLDLFTMAKGHKLLANVTIWTELKGKGEGHFIRRL